MRQAVVIIHGIGEQRPMQTLRSFVAGVFGLKDCQQRTRAFSKPDRISDILELRRLSVRGGCCKLAEGCDTDFYEFYWQHLMQGTTLRPIVEWFLDLLCHPTKLSALDKRLFRIWIFVFISIVATVTLASVVPVIVWPALRPWTFRLAIFLPSLLLLAPLGWIVIKWIVAGVLERFVLGYAGDAFRYLNPDPPNIAARRAIRTAGLELLRGLHNDELRRYERIVLVGHSLGSVIAYDLITWFWQEQHHRVELKRRKGEKPQSVVTRHIDDHGPGSVPDDGSPLDELHRLAADKTQTNRIKDFRAAQWKLWQEHRANGLPWMITDLVTLGSPLTHALVLLADDARAFCIARAQREFPTCPPRKEDSRDKGLLWRASPEFQKLYRILHHGAPFAITRWTNIYFSGDPVGGQLAKLFGKGIKDVPLTCGRTAGRWSSHIRYWDSREREACDKLYAALCLNEPACD